MKVASYPFYPKTNIFENTKLIVWGNLAAGKRIEFTTFDLKHDKNGELTPDLGLIADILGDFAKYHRAKTMRGAKTNAEKGI